MRWGGGLREEERGRGDKSWRKKGKLQLSAGRRWGVRSHASAQRTGSTAKYLYQRKQAAQQLDGGACQGPPPAPSSASPSPTGLGSPPCATVLVGWWAGEVLLQPSALQSLSWCL